jgi:hypothetical protein
VQVWTNAQHKKRLQIYKSHRFSQNESKNIESRYVRVMSQDRFINVADKVETGLIPVRYFSPEITSRNINSITNTSSKVSFIRASADNNLPPVDYAPRRV